MRAPRPLTRWLARIFPAGSGLGWGLLLAGLAAVLLWRHQVRREEQAERAAALHAEAAQIAQQLQGRLGEYELTLRGLRGLFEGSNKVEPDEFERYCKTTDPLSRLPGLLAVSTLHRVLASDPVRPPMWSEENGAGRAVPARPVYFPITYRYPSSPEMIGFDGGSVPVFAAAIAAAEKSDGLAVSQPVVFTNAALERRTGFVMVLPYFTGGAAHRGPPEGFVELVVSAPRLLDDILTPANQAALHLLLRDGGTSAGAEPLLRVGQAPGPGAWRQSIPFGGRVWLLTIDHAMAPAGTTATLLFYLAIMAVVLLAGLVAGLGIGRHRAHAAAATLRASEQRTRGLMEANLIGIFFARTGGQLLEANDAFLNLLGFSREDLQAGRIDLRALTPPEHQERTRLAVGELLQTGMAKPFEKDYFHRDGSRVPVLVGAARIAAGPEEFATFVLDLTARKKTEVALRDILLLLDRAQELAQLGIWQWEVAANHMHWSPELYRIYGLEPAAFTPSMPGYLDRVHPGDRARVSELIATVQRERRAQTFEERILRPDGQIRTLRTWGGLRLDAGGELTHLYGTCLDITDLRAAEAGLRANEERLRLANDAAQVGAFDWNIATGEVHRSAIIEKMFGYGPGEFSETYAAYSERIPAEDRPLLEAAIQRALQGGQRYEIEHRVHWPDGVERWMAGRGEVIRDEHGRPTRLIGTIMDITERKRMEDALRQSDERFRTLFDFSPDPVWIIDDHRFVECNQAAVDMLGYPDKASLRNTHPSELSPEFQPDGEPSYSKAERMMFLAQEKGLNRFEWVHRRHDKSDFFAEVTLSTMTIQGRQVIYCLWRDITQRKQAELSLAESEKKYRDIFNFAPVGIYRTAPDGRILAANQTLAAILGYDDAAALIGRDMASEIYLDTQERDRLIANYEPGGAASRLEVEFRRRDGARLWVQLDAHAIKDAHGRTRYFEGFVHDIDARKRAEAGVESTRAAHEKRGVLLLKIARSPALTGDLPAIVNAVTEAAAAGLNCARSSVWFFSAAGIAECAARYLAAEGRHAPGGTLRADDYPEYFRALNRGALLAIHDITRDPRTENFAAAYLSPLGITASLIAPLRAEGELAGMLTCDHAGGPRVWTPEEQGFLSALGDLLVLARETGERRRVETQLRALNEALEERVTARTAALARSNAELAVEVEERRRTLEELRKSTTLLTAVTEGTPDAIYVKDLDGRYVFINSAGAAFAGRTPEKMLGRADAEFYPPEIAKQLAARDANVVDLGRTQTFDEMIPGGADEMRILLSTKGVLRDQDGGVIGLFGISRDITERRHQEADLERLNRNLQVRRLELEALNQELETFSYSVSHDLRAPLRAIDGFSQALGEDFGGPLGVDGRNLLDRVRAGARQMGQLIDGLLQLSRASRGVLRREALDLSALAAAVVHDLQAGDPGRRQAVVIEPGLQAEGDPTLLRAVLQNLLGNAWKFTAGVTDAQIHFGSADARRHPGFVVRDTGVGFDPAYAGKLFQPFQRLHRASDFAGTGIGLATVQRIIRRHSGRVWAESQPGKGAAFYFTLWDATSDRLDGEAGCRPAGIA